MGADHVPSKGIPKYVSTSRHLRRGDAAGAEEGVQDPWRLSRGTDDEQPVSCNNRQCHFGGRSCARFHCFSAQWSSAGSCGGRRDISAAASNSYYNGAKFSKGMEFVPTPLPPLGKPAKKIDLWFANNKKQLAAQYSYGYILRAHERLQEPPPNGCQFA